MAISAQFCMANGIRESQTTCSDLRKLVEVQRARSDGQHGPGIAHRQWFSGANRELRTTEPPRAIEEVDAQHGFTIRSHLPGSGAPLRGVATTGDHHGGAKPPVERKPRLMQGELKTAGGHGCLTRHFTSLRRACFGRLNVPPVSGNVARLPWIRPRNRYPA